MKTKMMHLRITPEDQERIKDLKESLGLLSDANVIRYILRNFEGVEKNE